MSTPIMPPQTLNASGHEDTSAPPLPEGPMSVPRHRARARGRGRRRADQPGHASSAPRAARRALRARCAGRPKRHGARAPRGPLWRHSPLRRSSRSLRADSPGRRHRGLAQTAPTPRSCWTRWSAGFHVFVEKPLCITLADADAIIAAARRAGRVVPGRLQQPLRPGVRASARRAAALERAAALCQRPRPRPRVRSYFGADDWSAALTCRPRSSRRLRAEEARQVAAAVGADDPDTITAFSGGFLGSLVHQVNLVHGNARTDG